VNNRNSATYIIVGVIIIIIVGLYLFIRLYTPKYAWSENLNVSNEQPYGLSILYDIVKDSYSDENFLELKNGDFDGYLNDKINTTYIFIGTNYYIDSVNTQKIVEYVRNGNKALIATTVNPEIFLNSWLLSRWGNKLLNFIEKDTILTTYNPESTSGETKYEFYHQFIKKTAPYYWSYFDSAFFKETYNYPVRVISTIDDQKPNFVAIEIGDGTLYLHSNPIFLSNYHMLREETFNYTQSVWNEVNSETVIWDSYSSSFYNNPTFSYLKESPLRFILKHKSLRWAWYTLLITILLFIIVQSKRKQNVIPLVKVKKNNTLEYAKAVGSLYFQSKNHRIIAEEMINQLYSFIKARYNIKIGKEKDHILRKLSKLSGINEKSISELFRLEIKLKYDENAESDQLYKLYNLVDYFYKNCN
jgi:hypothetical protein